MIRAENAKKENKLLVSYHKIKDFRKKISSKIKNGKSSSIFGLAHAKCYSFASCAGVANIF